MSFWKIIFNHMGEQRELMTEFVAPPTIEQLHKLLIDTLDLQKVGNQTPSEIIEGHCIDKISIEKPLTSKPPEITY